MSNGASRAPTILVVDDQPDNALFMCEILQSAGYHVVMALGGQEALLRVQVTKPDLALLDMFMPEMNGDETCRRLRELPGCSDLPVIFVTAATDRGHLVNAFNAGAVDYITKPFLIEELLARVKTHVDLKLARNRLEVMLREREDVTHIVAHDLKNPLTCVMFAAKALRRPGGSPERREELIDEISTNAEEAMHFIQRFLSRGAEGQRLRQFTAEPLALETVAQQALQLQRSPAEARGIQLTLQGSVLAFADAFATRNVLQNLVSNAIRYSPSESEITIDLGPSRPGYARCAVLDRGPGVAPEEQNRLFQRYARLASARDTPGSEFSTGLGLAIAKHDVAQMGGHLWYEPREGGGAVFAFELPQHASPESA